ncbi:hypothetical protein [Streptomyces sp. 142MFCol3.1]|nr:hypothetical protein [Streptomyces sp. 142MFCol3.1]
MHLDFREDRAKPSDRGAVSIIRGPAYCAALAAADRSSDRVHHNNHIS